MKKEIKVLTLVYLFVMLLLMTSGLFGGVLGIIIYIIAFTAPVWLGLSYLSGDKKTSLPEALAPFKIQKDKLTLSLALLFPTLLLVLSVSYFTSLLFFAAFGKESSVSVSGNAVLATFLQALLPCVLEEFAFRYLPLRTIAKRSRGMAVILSAIFFALIHRSFFSIPYAFVAGIIFMAIDIGSDSVLPSILIHFANNAVALMTMGAYGFILSVPMAFIIVGSLALASGLILIHERRKLVSLCRYAFDKGEGYAFSYEPLYFIIPALFFAVSELMI